MRNVPQEIADCDGIFNRGTVRADGSLPAPYSLIRPNYRVTDENCQPNVDYNIPIATEPQHFSTEPILCTDGQAGVRIGAPLRDGPAPNPCRPREALPTVLTVPPTTPTETASEAPTTPPTDSTTPPPKLETGEIIGISLGATAITVPAIGLGVGVAIRRRQDRQMRAELPQPEPIDVESQREPSPEQEKDVDSIPRWLPVDDLV